MKIKAKGISTMLIIVGLIIMTYPIISKQYAQYQQQRITQAWENNLLLLEQVNASPPIIEDSLIIDDQFSTDNEVRPEATDAEAASNKRKKRIEYIEKNMEGILKIDKIKLNLPILKGATAKNLNISVSSIEQTGKAGAIGNYAIAGHRSHSFGRQFNRLDELQIGDLIIVDIGPEEYIYTVTAKMYVKPEETWVLNGNQKDKEITLITCHPMIKPSQRLIIKGQIQ